MNVSKVFCAATLLFGAGFASLVQAGEKIDEVLDVRANGQVSIENMRGTVEIVGWNKNQMSVTGELDEKAKGYTFETENGYTVFKVKVPKRMRGGYKDEDGSQLKIFVPKGSNVEFQSVNGDVSIKSVSGGANIHTVNGNVRAEALTKRIRLETVNGDIRAKGLDGKIKLATVNGKVVDHGSKGQVVYTTVNGSIDSRSQATRVIVENVNGEIDLDLKTTDELEISTVNGNVDASVELSNDATVTITTVSGNATLSVSGDVGGRFRLASHAGGRIKNRLTDDQVTKQKYGPARNLKFSIGGGDAKVEMTSVSGNLTIQKK
ncbi:MAG: DUF4097 family beta strand repeat protein [Algicola sp.]|nr:DUF4097 family beta strand repeat protein [Algicola sp.]